MKSSFQIESQIKGIFVKGNLLVIGKLVGTASGCCSSQLKCKFLVNLELGQNLERKSSKLVLKMMGKSKGNWEIVGKDVQEAAAILN